MVFKLPLHIICILSGLCLCFYALLPLVSAPGEAAISSALQEHILILDPGHGGLDGGAVGVDGTKESELNLEIALKTKELCKLLGIPHTMTRSAEDLSYPENATTISQKKAADQNNRIDLIRSIPNGIVYSIHQNSYPSSSVSGFQVLFGHNEKSKKLGEIIQTSYNNSLTATRRLPSEISDNIYIFKHIESPAVLIECGFISNAQDCALLQTAPYQVKLAALFTASYLEFINTT